MAAESAPPTEILPRVALVLTIALIVWSGYGTPHPFTWAFEVLPLAAFLAVLVLGRRRWRVSDLLLGVVTACFAFQCVGGRYTFAEVPIPTIVRETFDLQRNPADRVGHFLQGFGASIVLREWLLRRTPLQPGWTVYWLVAGTCLGFSALYEILEMVTVLLFVPGAGPEWLGMQGDPWDAQWDMTMALAGALLAPLLLGRIHRRSIARVAPDRGA